jgi:flagellar basal body rod protein FlgC
MSAIDISVSGLIAQGNRVSSIARNIANTNTPNYVPTDTVSISQDNGGVSTADVSDPNSSLADQIIDLNSAKNNYAADAKVIKVQDDMDKSLLDIIT